MYIKQKKTTTFGIGYINDEYLLSHIGDFDYPNNTLEKRFSLTTYYDNHSNKSLYEYEDKLVTLNELRILYLSEYYGIKPETKKKKTSSKKSKKN